VTSICMDAIGKQSIMAIVVCSKKKPKSTGV